MSVSRNHTKHTQSDQQYTHKEAHNRNKRQQKSIDSQLAAFFFFCLFFFFLFAPPLPYRFSPFQSYPHNGRPDRSLSPKLVAPVPFVRKDRG